MTITVSLDDTVSSPGQLVTPGTGAQQLSNALVGTSRVAARIAVDHQLRSNELAVNEGLLQLRDARREELLGDAGALNTTDYETTKGITERTATNLKDRIDAITRTLDNSVQRETFQKYSNRLLSATLDTVARHEADVLEKNRVAAVDANYKKEMAYRVSFDPTSFLKPPPVPEGMEGLEREDPRAELLQQTQAWIKGINPQLDDATVTTLAIEEMADRAHEAAMSQLATQGPMAVPDARKFLEQWGENWNPQQKAQLKAQIDSEIAYTTMDIVTRDVMADVMVEEIDELEARSRAMEQFRERFSDPETGAGTSPPQQWVDEMGRRMLEEVRLAEGVAEDRAQKEDAAILGSFFEVLSNPDLQPGEVEAAYRHAWQEASDDRPAVYSTLLRFKENFAETGTPFTVSTDADGWAWYTMTDNEIQAAPQSKLMEWVSHMAPKQGEKFIDRWTKIKNEGARDDLWSEMERAVSVAANLNGEDAPKKGTPAHGQRMYNLQTSIDQWRTDNKVNHDPDFTEIIDMAKAYTFDADADGPDWGSNKQTINEFVLNPEPLSMIETQDRRMVHTALAVMKTETPGRYAQFMIDVGSREDDDLLAALVTQPNMVANLLQIGISSPGFAATFTSAAQQADRYEPPVQAPNPGAQQARRPGTQARRDPNAPVVEEGDDDVSLMQTIRQAGVTPRPLR